MILEETTLLACRPEQAVAFLEAMDRHYLDWHPDHVSFEWLGEDGRRFDRFRFEEKIGRWRLRLGMKVDGRSQSRVVYIPSNPAARFIFPGMSFEVVPEGAGCRWTHRIALRIGPLELLIGRTFLEPLRRHMAEEAANLRQLTSVRVVT